MESLNKNLAGRPFVFSDVSVLDSLISNYFNSTKEEDWTITGLALALDCDRDTLLNYEKNDSERLEKGVNEEIIRLIKKAKLIVHNAYERDLRRKGRSGDIFALKNFGWSDRQEFDHTTKGEKISGELSPAQVAIMAEFEKKMKDSIVNE